MPSSAALIFLLALPLCGFASTTSKPAPQDSAAISGIVVDDSGRPARDATVFIYSARLKQGFAIVCPTCFVDCGKHTDTDAQGQFAITGLNPALKFRLLVVKDGFTAATKGASTLPKAPCRRSNSFDEPQPRRNPRSCTVGSPT
jgi:hypothetical protein